MKNEPGFIALIAVLILSAVALVLGTGLSLRTVGEANVQTYAEYASRAEQAANYCAERALDSLKADLSYAGNQMLSLNGDDCRILAVGGTGNNDRTITATSTVEGASRVIYIIVLEVDPLLKIGTWEEKTGL